MVGTFEYKTKRRAHKYPSRDAKRKGNFQEGFKGEQMPCAFAGLWQQNEGEERFAVITTTPNKMAVKVHHRMPVILNMKEKDAWLDADLDPIKALKMLDPYPEKEMEYFEVSKTLNSARFNDIRLTQKISNSQNIIDKSKNF